MSAPDIDPTPTGVHKTRLSKGQRLVRLLAGMLDPRAYLHAIKLINYYNYSHLQPLRKMKIGPGAAISPNAIFSNPDRISLGSGAHVGARVCLWAGPGQGRIEVGDNLLTGPDVMITAAGYRFNDGSPVTAQAMDEASVTIGNDVWLGARTIVLPGATIGDGCIVGAGSIVRGTLAPFSIAVGAPARVVGQRDIQDGQT